MTNQLAQFNPTLDKMGAQLGQAGAASLGPILAGFPGRFTMTLDVGEAVSLVQIVNDAGTVISTPTINTGSGIAWVDIDFGTDTSSAVLAVRNHIIWTTNYGVSTRHFWTMDFPTSNAIYVDNQNADGGEAIVDCNIFDGNPWAGKLDFSIALLPKINDEFFSQHEYSSNRWANTLRNWGGIATVQIWINALEIWPETDIADVDGYFWEPVSYGLYTIKARFRAAVGSTTYQEVTGSLRLRQTGCLGGP